jgi:hypothetical protein
MPVRIPYRLVTAGPTMMRLWSPLPLIKMGSKPRCRALVDETPAPRPSPSMPHPSPFACTHGPCSQRCANILAHRRATTITSPFPRSPEPKARRMRPAYCFPSDYKPAPFHRPYNATLSYFFLGRPRAASFIEALGAKPLERPRAKLRLKDSGIKPPHPRPTPPSLAPIRQHGACTVSQI